MQLYGVIIMIITIVSDVLGRENNGTTIAAMNLIRSMKARGHEVRVRMRRSGQAECPRLLCCADHELWAHQRLHCKKRGSAGKGG